MRQWAVFGLYPADYVAPDPTFEERNRVILEAIRAQGLQPGEAWVTGTVDPEVKKLLVGMGWKDVVGDVGSRLQPGA